MVKTIVKWAMAALLLPALAVAAYFALLAGAGGSATVFGFSGAIVTSGSMGGTLEIDDLIIARRRDDYAAGDVVTFATETGSLVTHRIAGQNTDGTFVTKGDANNTADVAPLPGASIVGEVVLRVPKVGGLIHAIRTPVGLALLLGCAVVLLAILLWPAPKEVPADETPAAP